MAVAPNQDLVFRQLFDADSSTYTYIIGDPVTKEAMLVDPVLEQVRPFNRRCWCVHTPEKRLGGRQQTQGSSSPGL